jgi:RNA polymerase sigma-70 factor (ECF subfamily)
MSSGRDAFGPTAGRILFSDLYARHSERILRYLARKVLEPEVAVDLTAETFAQAYLGLHRFRGDTEEEASAWLFGIARNLLRRYVRKGAAERRAIERLGIDVPPLDAEDHSRIEELAGLADVRAAARNGLANLPEDQRRALVLRIVEELPYPEVAERLDVTEVAARARVSRGLRALAASLATEGGDRDG